MPIARSSLPILGSHATNRGCGCPLSNAYFSSTEIFRLREALHCGVMVGLGSDIVAGYELEIQGATRMSVAFSGLREGLLEREAVTREGNAPRGPRIDCKESRNFATKEARRQWTSFGARDGSISERRLMYDRVGSSLVILIGFITDLFDLRPYSPPLRPDDQRGCWCARFPGPMRQVVPSPVETNRRHDPKMVVFVRC